MVKKERKRKKTSNWKIFGKKEWKFSKLLLLHPSSPHFTAVSSFPIASHVNDY